MRIAELFELRKFRIIDGDASDPGPGEIQVRVQAVGICGSDTHYFLEGGIGDTRCEYPTVLGHEPAGVVVKAGQGVTGWAPGDRAALEPALYCYHCEFCRSGRYNLCERIRFLSTPPDPGFFRERLNLPAANLLPLAPRLSFQYATLFEPLAVVLHSLKFAALQPLETAAVLGAGPIGLMTVILLKMCGAGRVFLVEPIAHRREMGRSSGADAVIDPSGEDASSLILRETGGRGVDLAIDCAAVESAFLRDHPGLVTFTSRAELHVARYLAAARAPILHITEHMPVHVPRVLRPLVPAPQGRFRCFPAGAMVTHHVEDLTGGIAEKQRWANATLGRREYDVPGCEHLARDHRKLVWLQRLARIVPRSSWVMKPRRVPAT